MAAIIRTMYRRNLENRLADAMSDTPAVLLVGARQVGKTTMARWAVDTGLAQRYVTFDTIAARRAALADPEGFIDGLGESAVIDEVQRVPELLIAVKRSIDEDRRHGRFLLTASADVRMLPAVSESLAGRIEILELGPLSQGELNGFSEGFVDTVLSAEVPIADLPHGSRASLLRRTTIGGYPEALRRTSARRRHEWFESYVETVLQREAREIANIAGLADLANVLALVAARSASLLNLANLARDAGMSQSTLRRYFELLRALCLVDLAPPWAINVKKKLVRSPKVFLTDSGLAAHLVGADEARLADEGVLAGPLVETFVLGELRKQIGWSAARPVLRHYSSHAGSEVDAVLEARGGRLAGIEVKFSASVSEGDFKGLKDLAATAGSRFVRGVVLYTGTEAVAFGKDLMALPMSALWTFPARADA